MNLKNILFSILPYLIIAILVFVLCKPQYRSFSNLLSGINYSVNEIGAKIVDLKKLQSENIAEFEAVKNKLDGLMQLQKVQQTKISFMEKVLNRIVLSRPEIIVRTDTFIQLDTLWLLYSLKYNPGSGSYQWFGVKEDTLLGSSKGRAVWYNPVTFFSAKDGIKVEYSRFPFHFSLAPEITYNLKTELNFGLQLGFYFNRLALFTRAATPDELKFGLTYLWLK